MVSVGGRPPYIADGDAMFMADFARVNTALGGCIDTWRSFDRLTEIVVVYDDKNMKWLFRGRHRTKRGDSRHFAELSPVFPSAELLLMWMKIEGWVE